MTEEDELSKLKVVETAQDGQGVKDGTGHQPEVETLPASLPAPVAGLPSAHIVHSDVLVNELNNRMHQFESGLAALQGELEGIEAVYQKDAEERRVKHEQEKADLMRRIQDFQRGIAILSGGLDASEVNK